MCLLMIKPSGVVYDHAFIVKAIEYGIKGNRDGIGGAVRKHSSNTLKLNKGFFQQSKEEFYKWLKECDIQENDELMVHLRYSTHGQKTVYNQHPYILGEVSTLNKQTGLSELTLQDDNVKSGVFAHNGVFDTYEYYDANLSDTYNWGLTHFRQEGKIEVLRKFPTTILSTKQIRASLQFEKVCFMFPDVKMVTNGSFLKDRGYLFSNGGYKSYLEDRGGSSSKKNFSELVGYGESGFDDETRDSEQPRFDFQGCGVGFNLSTQGRFPFERDDDTNLSDEDRAYVKWLEDKSGFRKPVIKSEDIQDAIIVEDEPKDEVLVEIIGKTQNNQVKKVVNSSFMYELYLPKNEPKIIKVLPAGPVASSRTDYFNKKYRSKKVKLGPLDKVIKVKSKEDIDFNIKYAVPADFSLPIKITQENRKNFIVASIYEETVGNTVFDAGSIFTVALVDIDKVCLRGLSFGVTDDSDYNEYLKRTHDEIGNNFKIRPKQSCINIYRDYMKLVATFGAEMSKNKAKILRNLAFTIDSQHKTDMRSKGLIVDRNYTFVKVLYNGTALLEFFNNFVKEVLEIQSEAKENSRKQSSLFNPPYENVDNHKANILV